MKFSTLVDMLETRASELGERTALRFLEDGEVDGVVSEVAYAQLFRNAGDVAATLIEAGAAPGDRVLLLYPPGIGFMEAFFGCLRAGVIAVPAYPPDPMRPERGLLRLAAIVKRAGARRALVPAGIAPLIEGAVTHVPGLAEVRWVPIDADAIAGRGEMLVLPAVQADTVAFLQFTSGSTGAPKGVVLTHRNLLENQVWTQHNLGTGQDVRCVSWLPPYHDLGLIGMLLHPMYLGAERTTFFSPMHFLQQPMRWLRAISHEHATDSGGPSFAFDLAARRATDADLAKLDLSSWRRAYNGAEPIRPDVIDRFIERFRPCGFRPEAMVGSYGLAEATLTVANTSKGIGTRTVDPVALERGVAEPSPDGRRLAVSGNARTTLADLRIVDPPSGEELPERRVGEIWIAGGSVAQGYWDDAEATQATFGAQLNGRTYLRTGDLGFVWDDQLFVTGRLKDLLIIRGRNVYPQDLEQTAEASHAAVRRGCVAAFSVDGRDGERVAIVAEADLEKAPEGPGIVVDAIRTAVSLEHDLRVDLVVLIPPRALPKTSSGKVARRRTRERFASPDAEGVLHRDDEASAAPVVKKDAPAEDRALLEAMAAVTGRPVGSLDLDAPVAALGLDSLSTVALVEALSEKLGRPIDQALLWRAPSLRASLANTAPSGLVVRPGVGIERGAVSFVELGALAVISKAPSQTPYNLFFALELSGRVDAACLKAALDFLAARHVSLRTGFTFQDGRFIRITVPAVDIALPIEDLSASTDPEAALPERCRELRHHTFDLARPPLVAAKLMRMEAERSVLGLLVSHTILDAFAFALLVEELGTAYQAFKEGRTPALPPLAFDAADVAAAFADLHGPTLRKGAAAFPPASPDAFAPPLDRPRPERPSEIGARIPFQLDATGATAAAASLGLPPAVAMVSAFLVALHRWAKRESVAFNLLHANRRFPGASRILGLLVYGETVEETFTPGDTWRAILQRAAPHVLEENLERQTYNMLVKPPSWRLLLNYYNRAPPPTLGEHPMSVRIDLDPVTYLWDTHDLMVRVMPTPAGMLGDVIYRSEIFDESAVTRLVSELERAVAECAELDREIVPLNR